MAKRMGKAQTPPRRWVTSVKVRGEGKKLEVQKNSATCKKKRREKTRKIKRAWPTQGCAKQVNVKGPLNQEKGNQKNLKRKSTPKGGVKFKVQQR